MKIAMKQAGMVEAREKLKRMNAQLGNLRPVLTVGADRISTLMSDSFRNQSNPAGLKWPDLAESTKENRSRRSAAAKKRDKKGQLTKAAKKLREKIKGNYRILDDTGRMKNSIFAVVIGNTIRFGSNVDYFGAHQLGTENAGKSRDVHIPRRAVAPVEGRGKNWALIRRGPAEKVFSKLENDLGRHVSV